MFVVKLIRIALVLLTLLVMSMLVAWVSSSLAVHRVTLAAGASSGESFVISTALKTVVERHYPKVKIAVMATGGTVESLRYMNAGKVQLVTAQADIPPGPSARLVAILYDDTFQLLVHKNSKVNNFVALQGARIALPQTGGQFQSFLAVASHFGLHNSDFEFIGSDDAVADAAFLAGQADALFRVRALGNPSINNLVQSGTVRFIRIDHAAAMKIDHPAFEPTQIPEGAYLGEPPMPAQDLPTVAIQRTLLADSTADATAVRAITEVLMERRQEMMDVIPPKMSAVRLLLASIHRPQQQTGIEPALHPAAAAFFDKDKPSFLKANADYIGLLLTMVLMVGSWIWQLKRWMEMKQKDKADEYSKRVLELLSTANEARSIDSLEGIRSNLLAILTKAVYDLDADRLSEESFQSFRAVLQIALDVTKERHAFIDSASVLHH